MSASKIIGKIDRMIDLLTDLKKEVDGISKMNRVLISPGNIWAIVDVGFDTGEEVDIVLPSISGGVIEMKFKSYSGGYIVYYKELDGDKVLKVSDGTEIKFEWVEDIATVFKAMFGGVKRNIIKDMLANIYSSGKDRPVGFLYDKYFAIVAPIVRENPIE